MSYREGISFHTAGRQSKRHDRCLLDGMPANPWRFAHSRISTAVIMALLLACRGFAEPTAGVAALHAVPWSPGNGVREGAGEFEVLLRVAQLERAYRAVGLVSVGDHNGMLPAGGEHALRQVALSGVPVVKLARGGDVAATPDGLFLDAGRLPEEQAMRVLVRCLELYGAPPAAHDPQHPTSRELTAIREHLRPFQETLAIAASPQVALR